MKKFLSLKYLTSISFVALLMSVLAYSTRPLFYIAYHQLENVRAGSGISLSQIEFEYNDSFPGNTFYITLNGAYQRLLGLRHVNERYLMDNGHLTYIIPEMDVTELADNTVAFRDTLAEMDIPFGYVSTLFKINADDKQLPVGVEDFSNENTDRYLSILKQNGVNVLDLRDNVKEQGLDHYSLYFRTDHHWLPETGFWAYTQIVSWLESLDESYAVDPAITDPDNYNYTFYENIFCGSAGRRVGPLYAGVDDFTVISPKFETMLTHIVPEYEINRQGSYDQALLFPEKLTNGDPLQSTVYGTYLCKDASQAFITNLSGQEALDVQSRPKKLIILKDSNALVVAPYLALSYDEICLVDLRLFGGNFLEFIQDYQPDMVLALYNPGAFETHNTSMFNFIR